VPVLTSARGRIRDDPEQRLMAGANPSTLTLQCRVKTPEQQLGSSSRTPGPDP